MFFFKLPSLLVFSGIIRTTNSPPMSPLHFTHTLVSGISASLSAGIALPHRAHIVCTISIHISGDGYASVRNGGDGVSEGSMLLPPHRTPRLVEGDKDFLESVDISANRTWPRTGVSIGYRCHIFPTLAAHPVSVHASKSSFLSRAEKRGRDIRAYH
jgi:hypothetical protein